MALQVEELTADYTGMINEADYQEYIRYDGTDQSTILPIMVESAIRQAESYCNASFGLKTYKLQKTDYNIACDIYLPFAPILSVSGVNVISEDGNTTALVLGTDYRVGGLNRKYISLLSGLVSLNSIVEVEYTAGTAIPANINPQIKEGILTILSENFENRMEGLEGSVSKMLRNSKVKLAPFRNNVY
tara:strand:+ start:7198 stop:7761 length:564 start_codon:yes stop_codon:yes gene_type:complete